MAAVSEHTVTGPPPCDSSMPSIFSHFPDNYIYTDIVKCTVALLNTAVLCFLFVGKGVGVCQLLKLLFPLQFLLFDTHLYMGLHFQIIFFLLKELLSGKEFREKGLLETKSIPFGGDGGR